jgi:hypothetical protein
VPQRALELMPIVPAVDQSIVGRPHEWIAHHAGAALDKVREASYSLLVRGGGAGDAAPLASAGGTRGAGMAVVAKALALCGATAAGGAACVASGVVEPGALGVGSGGEKAAIERPADAAAGAEGSLDPTANVVPDETALTTPDPVEPAASDDQQEVAAETPVQQQSQQFDIEAAPAGSGSSAGGNEFAGPSGGGGGSGGGGSGAQGFGIE